MCIAYFGPGQQRYVESVVCFLTVEKHARDDDHTSNCPSEHNLSTKISPTEVIKKKKKSVIFILASDPKIGHMEMHKHNYY